MARESRLGIMLVSVVGGALAAFVVAGFQTSVSAFFAVGAVGFVGSLAAFLLWFRRLFEADGGWRWLQAAMIVMSLHAVFLGGEAAARMIEARKQRNLKAREAFIVREYLPAWRSAEISSLHRSDPKLCKTLVPHKTARFLESTIGINSHGTRGREFSLEKTAHELRVLCLGASTTWGATVRAEDRPYPEVLEEILVRELGRPVTVINAGIAGLPVQCTASRLEHELLRFNPDCAVFYEGFANIPSGIRGEFRFQTRGSLLIQLAMLLDAQRPTTETPYDERRQEVYRKGVERIAELCGEHCVQLFLCTFALAYDEHTPREYLEFYQRIMPVYGGQTALSALDCVRINNRIVREVAEKSGDPVIDVAGVLGGRYEHFIDFCHFWQSGRDLLAREVAEPIVRWASVTSTTPSGVGRRPERSMGAMKR